MYGFTLTLFLCVFKSKTRLAGALQKGDMVNRRIGEEEGVRLGKEMLIKSACHPWVIIQFALSQKVGRLSFGRVCPLFSAPQSLFWSL